MTSQPDPAGHSGTSSACIRLKARTLNLDDDELESLRVILVRASAAADEGGLYRVRDFWMAAALLTGAEQVRRQAIYADAFADDL